MFKVNIFRFLNKSFLFLINYWLKGGLRQLIFSIRLKSLLIGFKNMKIILWTPYQSALSFEAPWPHIDGLLRPKNCNFQSSYKLKMQRDRSWRFFNKRITPPLPCPAQLMERGEWKIFKICPLHFDDLFYFFRWC